MKKKKVQRTVRKKNNIKIFFCQIDKLIIYDVNRLIKIQPVFYSSKVILRFTISGRLPTLTGGPQVPTPFET